MRNPIKKIKERIEIEKIEREEDKRRKEEERLKREAEEEAKRKQELKRIILISIIVFSILAIIVSIGATKEKTIDWSSLVLAEFLPEVENPKGKIIENSEEKLEIKLEKLKDKDITNFIKECKNQYEIDYEYSGNKFRGYNENGYKLEIIVLSDLCIVLSKPMEFEKIQWANNEAATLLPIPKSLIGNVEKETVDEFIVFVSKITKQEYSEYIVECQQAGFNINYNKENNYFIAEHIKGYTLKLTYEGYNIIKIEICKNMVVTDGNILEENGENITQEITTEIEKNTETEEHIEELEIEELEIITEKETTIIITTTSSGITVYVTPYGEKYHYSLSCAGKNGSAIDYDRAIKIYDPCKKCAY